MDELFWFGQMAWLAVLTYGAYFSLANAHRANSERARTIIRVPDKPNPPVMHPDRRNAGLEMSHG